MIKQEENSSTGSTPNPLAAMATTPPPPAPAAAAASGSQPQCQYPNYPVASSAHPPSQPQPQPHPQAQPPTVQAPSPIATSAPVGVPNPILGGGLLHPPITVSRLSPGQQQVPSPLASPILSAVPAPGGHNVNTSHASSNGVQHAHDGNYYGHYATNDSAHNLATSNVTNENINYETNDEPISEPPTNRRRRAHTIHWDNSASNESLEPVNFGSPSPTISSTKKNAITLRTASSGSLTSHTSFASFASGDASHDSHHSGVAMGGASSPTSKSQPISSTRSHSYASAPSPGPGSVSASGGGGTTDKRRKRLERNRESARLSRRRRKQYLEELEMRVTSMSEEMDRGRIQHAAFAVRTLRCMRLAKLTEIERLVFGSGGVGGSAGLNVGSGSFVVAVHGGGQRKIMGNSKVGVNDPLANGIYDGSDGNKNPRDNTTENNNMQLQNKPRAVSTIISSISKPLLEQHLIPLQTNLCRTNNELQVVNMFLKQQLMSMVQPMASKFVLWLTLQKDGFYRGGRAQSERLSAARIGERLLHSGKDKATPSEEMWPLICHEISLSYDQEDKIRQCQRAILANNATWVNRHTAAATKNVINSIQTTISGMHEAAKRREQSLLNVLTVEQRIAFLAWAARRGTALRQIAARKVGACNDEEAQKWQVSPHRHVAANLYISDHHLRRVKQHLPPTARFVNPNKLKKLSRRPSFESLAGHESDNNPKLNREASFPSTGSLKRSLVEVMAEDSNNQGPFTHSAHSAVTPESAQVAAQVTVASVLKDVLPIIPKSTIQYSYHPPYPQYRQYASTVPSHQKLRSPAAMPIQKPRPQARPVTGIRAPQPQPAPIPVAAAAPVPAPPQVSDMIDDIPMPTPVSVLMQTADEFITPYDMAAPQSTTTSSFIPHAQLQPNGVAAPETVSSSLTSINENRHQSAPQLSNEQQSDFTYPSILPPPMGMIPVPEEGALVNNPLQGDNDDLFLDDLAMDADDWAIGEGFDMEM